MKALICICAAIENKFYDHMKLSTSKFKLWAVCVVVEQRMRADPKVSKET